MNPGRLRSAKAEAHAEAQRTRILDAALKCFIQQGFHAASMANVAATAQMSAGLIYRYFRSKNAIVLAIIDRELEAKRARISELHAATDLAAGLTEAFRQLQKGDPESMSAALLLEMSAEATRDPAIAEALLHSDRLARGDFLAWLTRDPAAGGKGLEPRVAEARALLVQCLMEGLIVRAVRDPGLDSRSVKAALEPLLGRLLEP